MARILPDGWKALHVTGGAAREIETLALLEATLPDTYTVYHSVHWTRLTRGDSGFSVFGELDFVVVGPSGRVAAIEQKAGTLEETPEGLVKVYAGTPKNVKQQISRSIAALRGRLAEAFGPKNYGVEELFYCPDYTVADKAIAGIHASRIVDAPLRNRLADVLLALLPPDEPALACQRRIHPFLEGELSLMPDASAMVGAASKLVTQVSSGLATWARNIHFTPFRLRVMGTAGSGKTQLAIGVLQDAARAGKRALYVCFNRPLADHLASIVDESESVHAMTFHTLCRDLGIQVAMQVVPVDEVSCAEFTQRLGEWPDRAQIAYDVIVVDEGQDFLQPWVNVLDALLAPEGSWWWLEDSMQNLYRRPAISLPGWVEMHAHSNYRSPRDIVNFLRQLKVAPRNIQTESPVLGSDVSVTSYSDSTLVEHTEQILKEVLASGYSPENIVILSFHGLNKSKLANVTHLGDLSLHSPTGTYDEQGNPVYRDGDLLFDSVYRFKGRSAPCVILTEIDFEQFDENTQRVLFVGATRATMKLCLIMSDRAAEILLDQA